MAELRHRWRARTGTLVLIALMGVGLGAAPAGAAPEGPVGGSAAVHTPRDSTLPADVQATIDGFAEANLTDGITGIVVGLDDPVLGRSVTAYGTADGEDRGMGPDLYYRIASVTKTFTAQAVLELVDEGRLALADPVSRFVSGVPNGETITVRDLLAMRSGLFDFTDDPAFTAAYTADPLLPG